MNSRGLPARLLYAAITAPVVGVAVVYVTVWLLPWLQRLYGVPSPPPETEALFRAGLEVAIFVTVPAFLCALTMPWKRRRHRRGRRWRLAVSGLIVVASSLAFAGLGHSLIYDLLFAAWLSYTLALTFVRYGLVDQQRVGGRVPADEDDAAADE
ncbi:MAG TPA: hypothetical protein VG714_10700 [Acidobacteriaceae bacterium]|nr:hypothetical protein [Acidobacteriaceae bacterium]